MATIYYQESRDGAIRSAHATVRLVDVVKVAEIITRMGGRIVRVSKVAA